MQNLIEFNILELKRVFPRHNNSEQDQIILHRELCEHVEKLSITELQSHIDEKMISLLRLRIGQLETSQQFRILIFLELLARRGTEQLCKYENNLFYSAFKTGGILKKIRRLLRNSTNPFANDYKEHKFEGILSLLVQTCLFMMRSKLEDKGILQICADIAKPKINSLILKLKQMSQFQNKHQNNIRGNDKLQETSLQQEIRMIQALSHVKTYLCNFVIQLQGQNSQLFHINCPDEIQCQKSMIITPSSDIDELQNAIYQLLCIFLQKGLVIQNFINDHEINKHIVAHLTNQAQHFNRKAVEKQSADQQAHVHPNYNLIINIIKFLQNYSMYQILMRNAASEPGLVSVLFRLISYQNRQDEDISACNIAVDITKSCMEVIKSLFWNGGKTLQFQMIYEHKIIELLSILLGSCGGSMEQNAVLTLQSMNTILNIFIFIPAFQKPTSLAYPELHQEIEELIEKEGTFEEIESHLFHSKSMNEKTKSSTVQAKSYMMNIFKNATNRRN